MNRIVMILTSLSAFLPKRMIAEFVINIMMVWVKSDKTSVTYPAVKSAVKSLREAFKK